MEMALGKRGPQDVKKVFANGTDVQWQEHDDTLTGQVWSEQAKGYLWLLLSGGSFPGEMRLARRIKGAIAGVNPTVYDCLGRRYHMADEPGAASEAPAVQLAFEGMEEPEPDEMPETLPLFDV